MGGGRTMFLPNTTTDQEDQTKGKRGDNRDLTKVCMRCSVPKYKLISFF
jgi:hypothetical protein